MRVSSLRRLCPVLQLAKSEYDHNNHVVARRVRFVF